MRLSNTTDETFQQSGKQDSFRHIMKRSASIYESWGSQFFRTTTGIQSGPDVFDESSFVMTFLTILAVIEICSFRLVVEGKTGKEIPELWRLEFFEKFLANNLTYRRTSLPFFIVNWWIVFYIGRGLSLNVLMKVMRCF